MTIADRPRLDLETQDRPSRDVWPAERSRPSGRRDGGRCYREGFTLIELLVVIGIIAILATLGVMLSARVGGAGKEAAARGSIKVLEESLAAYKAAQDRIPPALVADPSPNNPNDRFLTPVADAVNLAGSGAGGLVINSVGLFMEQTKEVPSAESVLKGLDSRLLKLYQAPGSRSGAFTEETAINTVMDGWGRPIRYVHPAFHGIIEAPGRAVGSPGTSVALNTIVQGVPTGKQLSMDEIRRNALKTADREATPGLVGDSDGGFTVGGRPYFYSAGADGDPSTIEDNVYVIRPSFPRN